MKLPHLPHFNFHRFDRLAFQTALELAAGAVLFLLFTRWLSY